MIYKKDLENIHLNLEPNIMENLKMTNLMVLVLKFMLVEINIKVNG